MRPPPLTRPTRRRCEISRSAWQVPPVRLARTPWRHLSRCPAARVRGCISAHTALLQPPHPPITLAITMADSTTSAASNSKNKPLVGVVMGSKSDWETLRHADETLAKFDVPHESRVVSAHRTPELMRQYALDAEKR